MGDLDDERAMYLAIAMTPGIGPHRLATLLQACSTSLGAHSAPFAFLCGLPGFSRAAATAVREARVEEGYRLLRQAEEMGARVMTPQDVEYPALLRTIGEPPPVLFLPGPSACSIDPRSRSWGAETTRSTVPRFAAPSRRRPRGVGSWSLAGWREVLMRWVTWRHWMRAVAPSASWAMGWVSCIPRPTVRSTSGWLPKGCCSPSFPGRAAQRPHLPPTKPIDQRAGTGDGRGRGSSRLRCAHHGRGRFGSGKGCAGGSGKHHQPHFRRYQPPDPGWGGAGFGDGGFAGVVSERRSSDASGRGQGKADGAGRSGLLATTDQLTV